MFCSVSHHPNVHMIPVVYIFFYSTSNIDPPIQITSAASSLPSSSQDPSSSVSSCRESETSSPAPTPLTSGSKEMIEIPVQIREVHRQTKKNQEISAAKDDHSAGFGDYSLCKLRQFPPYQRALAMKHIQDYLFDIEFVPQHNIPPSNFTIY